MRDDEPAAAPEDVLEQPPPVLGSWRTLSRLVIGELALLVALFALLREWAS